MPLEKILKTLETEAERQVVEIDQAAQVEIERIRTQAWAEAEAVRQKRVAAIQAPLQAEQARILNQAKLKALQTVMGTREALITSALERGATELLIGIGGSATNDGGAGMLTALGASFTDTDGAALPPGGAALTRLHHIEVGGLDPRLAEVQVRIASDVTAPLLGTGGASAVFGPQKGADPSDVATLEAALARLVEVTQTALGHARPERPGAGAAGGLGFGLMEFLAAECDPGVEVIAETVGLAQALIGADWVFTGEGSVDAQTMLGKTPFGVARVAAHTGTQVVIFAGRVSPDADVLLANGVAKLVAITAPGTPLEQALRDGPAALTRAAAEVCRTL